MTNCYRGRGRANRPPEPQLPPAPPEPQVRRWPHPVEGAERTPEPEPNLYYIRCALSYQNQLLADIRALLQQLLPQEKTEDA